TLAEEREQVESRLGVCTGHALGRVVGIGAVDALGVGNGHIDNEGFHGPLVGAPLCVRLPQADGCSERAVVELKAVGLALGEAGGTAIVSGGLHAPMVPIVEQRARHAKVGGTGVAALLPPFAYA